MAYLATYHLRRTDAPSRKAWPFPKGLALGLLAVAWGMILPGRAADVLWDDAQRQAELHRFSVLFDIQDVTNVLAYPAKLTEAIGWCRTNALTKVYIESFRNDYQADSNVLVNARVQFRKAGFEVAGCVSTEEVGRPSLAGFKDPPCEPATNLTLNTTESCYADLTTQERLGRIFRFTASIFDEIIIDDYWFTICACPACNQGRTSQTVTVQGQSHPVEDDSWQAYRRELMLRISEAFILTPARDVNPNVKVVLKFPNWYDKYPYRGYDPARQTPDFDEIWVGTETRNITDPVYGGIPQYQAYFLRRWLEGIGAAKTGGGWYDWIACTPQTYLEQARQTVLGGAAESVLFCYGGMRLSPSEAEMSILRANMTDLWKVAEQVRTRQPIGAAAYKPVNSDPCKEINVFSFVGMLGIPLAPCHEFPFDAPAAFFSYHALSDPDFANRLTTYIRTGRPVLITDGLRAALGALSALDAPNVKVLPVNGNPMSLLQSSEADSTTWRNHLLKALRTSFVAPANVSLYLFNDGSSMVESFLDEEVNITLNGKTQKVPPRSWVPDWR